MYVLFLSFTIFFSFSLLIYFYIYIPCSFSFFFYYYKFSSLLSFTFTSPIILPYSLPTSLCFTYFHCVCMCFKPTKTLPPDYSCKCVQHTTILSFFSPNFFSFFPCVFPLGIHPKIDDTIYFITNDSYSYT